MAHLRQVVTVLDEDVITPSEAPGDEPSAYGVPAKFQPVRKPRTDGSYNPQKRMDPFQFGTRYLEEGDDLFAYNAWDHVETDDAYKEFAKEQYEKQKANPVSDADRSRCHWGGRPE
jgi:tRNAThr (cytosine32-N3)-methyltransferase